MLYAILGLIGGLCLMMSLFAWAVGKKTEAFMYFIGGVVVEGFALLLLTGLMKL